MKATDLMIGDWVTIKVTHRHSKVSLIEPQRVYTKNVFPLRYDEIEAVPLTKEILVKNGWKKLKTAYWWRGGEISVLLDMYDEQYGWCLSIDRYHIPCECKFVHQLQQAMHLCGITKEIEL